MGKNKPMHRFSFPPSAVAPRVLLCLIQVTIVLNCAESIHGFDVQSLHSDLFNHDHNYDVNPRAHAQHEHIRLRELSEDENEISYGFESQTDFNVDDAPVVYETPEAEMPRDRFGQVLDPLNLYSYVNFDPEDYLLEEELNDNDGISTVNLSNDNDERIRKLSVNSATIGQFESLDCNSGLHNEPCDTTRRISQILPSGNNPLIIPCGTCYLFDLTGGEVVIAGGIDIRGKLKFSDDQDNVMIKTKFVIVQGELEIVSNHNTIGPNHEIVTFQLTGSEDVLFKATDSPNQNACYNQTNSECNLGPKPFFVGGGKINIQSFPRSGNCKTHTPILKQVREKPSKDVSEFEYTGLPISCPTSDRKYIHYDFNDGNVGNWTGGFYGSHATVQNVDGALKVTNRIREDQGPTIDIVQDGLKPHLCLEADKKYLFSMKIRLDRVGMDGQDSYCNTGSPNNNNWWWNCPRLRYGTRSPDETWGRYDNGGKWLHPFQAPKYGEWGDFSGLITFQEHDLWENVTEFFFYVERPDPSTDITIDDFTIELIPEDSIPDPNDVCGELVMNGNAEVNGMNPYPQFKQDWDTSLKIAKEGSNNYFQMTHRNDYRSNIVVPLDYRCIDEGLLLQISLKIRLHADTAQAFFFYIRGFGRRDERWYHHIVLECPPQKSSDGWKTCSGEFYVDEIMGDSSSSDFSMRMEFIDDSVAPFYDVDLDDISIRNLGFVSKLIVNKDDALCWGEGAEIHVGSSNLYSFNAVRPNGFTSNISSVLDKSDGTREIVLETHPTIPIITIEDDQHFAADIALVSRNVKVVGDVDEADSVTGVNHKGAYFQILHTPNIVQKISGVQFSNMGRRSEDDRFGLQILYSGSLEGTEISMNSFYKSNHRCIVIEGSSNITINDNVGVGNVGHCMYQGPNARDNTIRRNFVSETTGIPWNQHIAGSTDYHAAGFYNWNGPNDYFDNISVGNRYNGFYFYNDWQFRLEDLTYVRTYYPRSVPLGEFQNNQAKSNGNIGMHFSNHEQVERIVLSGLKILKSRYQGLYVGYAQRIKLKDSMIADNGYGIEFRWCDDVEVENTDIIGISDSMKVLSAPPYNNKRCHQSLNTHEFPLPVGYKMQTAIWRFDQKLSDDTYLQNKGMKLTNVRFSSFDHDDECQNAVPIKFDTKHIRDGHWNYVSSFKDVDFGNGSKFIDALTAADIGIEDIVITDVDGSSDPLGQASGTSSFVSDRPHLTDLAGGQCKAYWQGIAYCKNTCYRTVTFEIDQTGTSDYDMQVKRTQDNKIIYGDKFYLYDGVHDTQLKAYESSTRKFSVSLPSGTYQIEFFDGTQPVWPLFAYEVWGGKPDCDSNLYANGPDVTFTEPVIEDPLFCNSLIRNGGFSQGVAHWYHRNDRNDTDRGYISELDGVGRSGSKAIGYYNRHSFYDGVGQNIDTRCLHKNANQLYEIKVWFRRESDGTGAECDRFNSDRQVRCPEVTIKHLNYDDATKENIKNEYPHHAKTVMPTSANEFNMVHGVVEIKDGLETAARALVYIEYAHEDFDLIIDDFSVDRLQLATCNEELIRNGDYETGYSTFWDNYGTLKFNILTIDTGKAIEVKEKSQNHHGILQWIYMDKSCMNLNDRYQITAKMRMKNAQGSYVDCDIRVTSGEHYCGRARIETRTSLPMGNRNEYVGDVVAIAEDQYDGWSIMTGTFTMNEFELNHLNIHLRFVDSPTTNTIIYDDISMVPIPMTCEEMILNPSFQGTSSFWKADHHAVKYSIINDSGVGNSGYALLFERTETEGYGTHHYLYQDLDVRCITQGEELEISAKFKILDDSDLTKVLTCDTSDTSPYTETHCPLMFLYGYNCGNGASVSQELFSESQDTWSTTHFNQFRFDFVVDENLATCKNVRLGVGRRLPPGQAYLVSEIRFGHKTTSSPTRSPTLNPTDREVLEPTATPTSKPSTNILRSCPSVGFQTTLDVTSAILVQAGASTLCTLTKVVLDHDGDVLRNIPLARSYNNNNWEVAGGDLASVIFANGISCYSRGCQIDVPSPKQREEYRLVALSHSLDSKRDEIARFLETSTFGIKREELDSLDGASGQSYSTIVNWMQSQMDTGTTPITSHREYWRKRANPRAPAPTEVGIPDHPCHQHSRWRRYSFVRNDFLRWLPHELKVEGTGPYTLYLDGVFRTVVDDFWLSKEDSFQFDPDVTYKLCRAPDPRRLYIMVDGICVTAENPNVSVPETIGSGAYTIDLQRTDLISIDEDTSTGEQYILQNALSSSVCNNIPTVPDYGDKVVFGRVSDGTWLQFDPRLQLEMNTVQSPMTDGGKGTQISSGGASYCSNPPRSFLNENSCVQSSTACHITSASNELEVVLNDQTIAELNILTQRYVYRLEGLNVVDQVDHDFKIPHPCNIDLRSRWIPKDSSSCNPTSLNSNTNETLHELLSTSSDFNPNLRDIYFPVDMSCDPSDTDPDIEIIVGETCWKRVHEDYMSIYDMTYWASEKHPGMAINIQKWSNNNGTVLVFPNNPVKRHPMSRWYDYNVKFTYIGRYGDYMRIRDLPNELRTETVTTYYDTDSEGSSGFACGSPGEVSNSQTEGLVFDIENKEFDSNLGIDRGSNRQNVWFMVSLSASDQLRQRVAWALSQILVVVTDAIGSAGRNNEWFFAYYDIFIRNAFGNYRDILREISFSPIMAENLSYLQSKSSAYLWERYSTKAQADENFAREIMQLFTMGIKKLNMDGSLKLNREGKSELAYTNEDIMSLSRAWTGFDLQPSRSNIEGGRHNRLDPMKIEALWRDKFPKTDTTGGYIGDHYPLCADLPEKAFLRKGATYRFLGSSPLPELMSDPTEFAADESITRVVLAQSSKLREKLCNSSGGNCNHHNSVVLDSSIPCDGDECIMDSVRVVQVGTSSFYEYVRVPCVNQVFYEEGRKLSLRHRNWPVLCGNPELPEASEACCTQLSTRVAERNHVFDGERMLLSTAEGRCADINKEICDFYDVTGDRNKNSMYFWTSDNCHVRVKVNADGMATVVHDPSDSTKLVPHVDEINENYFKVYWKDGDYPKVSSNCGVCAKSAGNTCLCNIEVAKRKVFDRAPTSIGEALEKLYIGAPDPSSFDTGTYSATVNSATGIKIHRVNGQYDTRTIFEFTDDKGRNVLLKNSDELVIVQGGDYRFRNAPQFMSFVPTETAKRDAYYETEATLDHYFYHDNTAPFLAMRLIQRLSISNPSPRYISIVAAAFKEGLYRSDNGQTFGAGIYGDMAATFASIYLDREARSVVLDADPSHGGLREPILKLVAVMRSMELQSYHPVTYLRRVKTNIGQLPHAFDSVFSFFLPEYKPLGRVGDATLVAPEATLLDMPKIVGIMNAFRSLVKYGLSSCAGGFGWHHCREREYLSSPQGELKYGIKDPNTEFQQETFEGPSLNGGYDNQWVGRHFYTHNDYGEVVQDPLNPDNHVYQPSVDWHSRFYSAPATRSGNNTIVKFKYYASQIEAGGCIGYDEKIGDSESLTGVKWIYCDARKGYADNVMTPIDNSYISCQFEIPSTIHQFRLVVGDRITAGEAYFDDIHVTSGTGTTCDSTIVTLVPSGENGHSNRVVDELATLLTAGRLSAEHRKIIAAAYDDAGSANDALKLSQQLILSSAEFHSTNIVKSSNLSRPDVQFPAPSNRPYRAIIYIMFSGGADSFNILAPHSCNNGKDLYQEYLDVRQQVAIPKLKLLPINADNQICEKFGIHPDLKDVQDLYNDNDLLFFANTGVLSQPVDKTNYNVLTQTQLFAHNHMQREAKRVDPFGLNSGTGVLGRMTDILSRQGHNVGSFSVDRFSVALVGQPGATTAPMIVNRDGVPAVYLEKKTRDIIKQIHNSSHPESGFFGDTWSAALSESLNTNDLLSAELEGIQLKTEFPTSYLSRQLRTVSKIIASRNARGVNADTFYVEVGGFDTHTNVEENLSKRLIEVNEGIKAFSDEMKVTGLWNHIAAIQTSDFARTLNPNSGDGTDHAWGGNYIMFGGAVKGGKILGEYPHSLSTDGDLVLNRGRIIPSTPWDAVFKGIARWVGVPAENIDEVCPNLQKFDSFLFEDNDMFYLGGGSSCSSSAECNDNNPATQDACELGKCRNVPIPNICGNGICEKDNGEFCSSCPKDCVAPTFCDKLGQNGNFDGYSASSTVQGVTFDVKAVTRIAVTGVDFNVNDGGVINVKLFTKATGTGARRDRRKLSEWFQIAESDVEVVDGVASITGLNISIEPDTTQSFYGTFAESQYILIQENVDAEEAVKSNEDIEILAGEAFGSSFDNPVDLGPTAFAGAVNYDKQDVEPVTYAPTPAPTPSNKVNGGGGGDPHFTTFNGKSFSFHGECDLVVLASPKFALGLGLDVHIRTTRVDSFSHSYSYISGVAIRIGEDVLEVTEDGEIVVNGANFMDDDLSAVFGGYSITKSLKGSKKNIVVYDLSLSNANSSESIQIRCNSRSGMIFLDVFLDDTFYETRGLLGTGTPGIDTGILSRDGQRNLDGYWNTFGEEWQVTVDEPKLFQENRAPQHPRGCIYESQSKISGRKKDNLRRRLMTVGSNKEAYAAITLDKATMACNASVGKKKDFCIGDIMATGSLELAEDPFYLS